MNALQQAKRVIRAWIQEHWDDQRLAEVYAFNQDGNMRWVSSCACLLGVTTSKELHNYGCERSVLTWRPEHYMEAAQLQGAQEAEQAYFLLGLKRTLKDINFNERICRARLSAIIRAEMRRRASCRPGNAMPPLGELVSSGLTV